MDENTNIDQLREQGWEEMSVLLDTHMPQQTNRRPILWYWLAGAAALFIGVVVPVILMMDDTTESGTVFTSQEYKSAPIEKNTTKIDDGVKSKTSLPLSDPIIAMGNREDTKDLSVQSQSFLRQDAPLGLSQTGFKASLDKNESETGVQSRIPGQNSPVIAMESMKSLENKGASLDAVAVSSLFHTLIPVEYPNKELTGIPFDRQNSIEIAKSSGRIKAFAFTENMWSFSDRFGFVNVGPGVQYGLGKWTLGLYGGLTLPIPGQKSFYSSNQPFSNSFNFSSSADAERVDNKVPGFAGSGSVVYYEKYTMKPGYIFGFSVRRQLINRWGVGFDLGRIGFRYDFTQRAEPNQNIAASTDLANVMNNLWYGGMSVNYHVGHQWTIHGGARVINLLNGGDVGVLPALRLEYGF